MDIELLRTFLEVERLRHFGNAAKALHLTQAAVSARIKLLEGTLGVKLFDRLRRDIRLTPEGTRLVRHADVMIANWRKARQEVSAGGASNQLSIAGSIRLWDVLLQNWVHQLQAHMPDVSLIAHSQSPDILTRQLLDGVLDVAVMLEPAHIEVLQVVEVATITLTMVTVEPDKDIEGALARDYFMVDWGLGHALEHRRLFPDAPEPHVRLGHATMALQCMRALGRGSAYLPEHMVSQELAEQALHLVAGAPVIRKTAFAAYPIRSNREELITRALAFVRPA